MNSSPSSNPIETLEPFEKAPACVVIASRNGGAQIAATIALALDQCPVYVVSDASDDDTAIVARDAGAEVLELTENVGKPVALRAAFHYFRIAEKYHTVAIVDDDTAIAPDFISRCLERMDNGTSIVVGHTVSAWDDARRWNPFVAGRAFAYWKYQLFIRRGQSALNVMNCIAGSNSLYRTSVLAGLLDADTPYIVDDTFWTLECHRRKLGRITYAPKAEASIQDPINLKDWYRQNLRWMWGTMQGVRGHRVGRKATMFDLAYGGLIVDWVLYVIGWPIILTLAMLRSPASALSIAGLYLLGYLVWATIGAVALRRWRLIPMFWSLVVMDWIQRVNFCHAAWLALTKPTVESCTWESPTRYDVESPTETGSTADSDLLESAA